VDFEEAERAGLDKGTLEAMPSVTAIATEASFVNADILNSMLICAGPSRTRYTSKLVAPTTIVGTLRLSSNHDVRLILSKRFIGLDAVSPPLGDDTRKTSRWAR
jgi:hypothetical protein